MSDETTIVSWAAAIHQALSSQNLSPDDLFAEIGLDTALLRDANARYPVDSMTQLWQRAIAVTGNPAFSLEVPRYVQPGTLHGLGLAALASQTLNDAVRRLERFSHIVSTAANVVAHGRQDPVCIEFVPTCIAADAAYEAFIATTVQITRLMLQQPNLAPIRIELRSPAPDDPRPYKQFFGCTIQFDADRWGIHIGKTLYEQPLSAANAMLATANDQVVQNYLAQFTNDIARKTRQAILDQLAAGLPSLEEVAVRLNVSARNLQRQLADAESSFTELRDGVQQEMAKQWLSHSQRSLAEITFRLGFSDQSNFSKAFKRWTGKTPGQYRQDASQSS